MNNNSCPMVSIVTVTYNSALYVRDAIESVLAQTYSNFEYIICDDCSTDASWEIICTYSDPRIKSSRNEKNLGEYANRNKALQMATGEYILYIDGDDYLYAHGLEIYVWQALRFPEANMVIQRYDVNNIIYPILLSPRESILNYFYGTDLLTSSFGSNFFKTAALKTAGLPTAFIQGDTYVRFVMAAKGPVAIIPGVLAWVRETPGQASSVIQQKKGRLDSLKIEQKLVSEILPEILDEKDINKIRCTLAMRYWRTAIKNLLKLKWDMVRVYWQAWRAFSGSSSDSQPVKFLNLSLFQPSAPYTDKMRSRSESRPE